MNKKIIIILFIVLLVVATALILFYLTTVNLQKINNSPVSYTVSSAISTPRQAVQDITQISSAYGAIEATLPKNFTMKLITDTTGMKYKVDNVIYEGIVKIEILNEKQQSVITISGASGVGGNTNIKTCFNFADTDTGFMSTLESSMFSENAPYKEFSLFGTTVRLTDNNHVAIKFDPFSKNGNVFCEPIFYSFEDIGFDSLYNNKRTHENLYAVTINQFVSNQDLFQILSTLKLV